MALAPRHLRDGPLTSAYSERGIGGINLLPPKITLHLARSQVLPAAFMKGCPDSCLKAKIWSKYWLHQLAKWQQSTVCNRPMMVVSLSSWWRLPLVTIPTTVATQNQQHRTPTFSAIVNLNQCKKIRIFSGSLVLQFVVPKNKISTTAQQRGNTMLIVNVLLQNTGRSKEEDE